MIFLQDVSYIHPNRDVLFSNINLTIQHHDKIALIGNNGAGKSTLLKIVSGQLTATSGSVKSDESPYLIPQIFGQFNDYSVAQALGIADKLDALKQILDGHVTEQNLLLLGDDWAIDERCREAFAFWKLEGLDLSRNLGTLSGGQKTKVFLAGIKIHQPKIVLLDEPSNHLDLAARKILYDYIGQSKITTMAVSHDRTLLNLLDTVYELSGKGLAVYGGNYDFYLARKTSENEAMTHELRNKEKELRKSKAAERESLERQQKQDAKGKKKQEKAGLPTIMMNTFKNNAEKSTARLKGVHDEKVNSISKELTQLRKELPETDKMKLDLIHAALHTGKILVTAEGISFGYNGQSLWEKPLDFQIRSGERIAVKGQNGSGKTTVVKLMLGEIAPSSGTIVRADVKAVYIDQDYSLIDNDLTVYEQAEKFNFGILQEHEVKTRLNRFLFTKTYWDKKCLSLSGGEKMRLMLCCLTIGNQAPDLIVLDEPTNNLDIQNIEILTAAINDYRGTLLVISHDQYFLDKIEIESVMQLD